MTRKRPPEQFLARFSGNLLRVLENIREKSFLSFLEFHLVYISILSFLGQKLRNVETFSPFFQFLTVLSSFFGKFYAQITRANLRNLWIFFDFKNYQTFLKYHARKVKFRRFTLRSEMNVLRQKTAIIFFHLACF